MKFFYVAGIKPSKMSEKAQFDYSITDPVSKLQIFYYKYLEKDSVTIQKFLDDFGIYHYKKGSNGQFFYAGTVSLKN